MKAAAIGLVAALAGCATLEPDAVRLDAGHQSSIGQHLQSGPQDFGMNTVNVAATWRRGRWVAEVSEGYAVQGIDACVHCSSRDVFEAHVGYELWQR